MIDRLAKQRARGRVRSQLKAGLLIKPSVCSHCGDNPGPGKDGRSLIQGHHHMGYDHPTEVEWLCAKCHRLETPINPVRGSANSIAKLTEAIVAELRLENAVSPICQKETADRLGVDPSCIRQALKGKTWKHVQPLSLLPAEKGRATSALDGKEDAP